jgi:hypothetical protein
VVNAAFAIVTRKLHRESSRKYSLTFESTGARIAMEAVMASKSKRGRPKSGKLTKDRQIMMRTTDATADELERIAVELDRSVSWLLNDPATRFIASCAALARLLIGLTRDRNICQRATSAKQSPLPATIDHPATITS